MSAMVDAARSGVVAYYESLPLELARLIEHLQGVAAERLGDAFEARPLAEVHATVIGLEQTSPLGDCSGLFRPFNAGPLSCYLLGVLQRRPLTVQFGGFDEGDRRLLSRGLRLYERGFTAKDGKIVLIGWPVSGTSGVDNAPHLELVNIRRGCETFGVRHKYHVRQNDADPDLHLVIGNIGPGMLLEKLTDLEVAVRRELAASAVRVTMSAVDLALVEYVERSLPRSTTVVQPLLKLVNR
jgi:hypothetical protein